MEVGTTFSRSTYIFKGRVNLWLLEAGREYREGLLAEAQGKINCYCYQTWQTEPQMMFYSVSSQTAKLIFMCKISGNPFFPTLVLHISIN